MNMLGTTLLIVGLAGIACKVWDVYAETKDPPREFYANVAKTRLDTKKDNGIETYTYIITFYLSEINKYVSFSVAQKDFDEIIEKSTGTLLCNLKRQKFLSWHADKAAI
ncbi:MAG: hypothetical protein FWC70_08670 [Defluviitaleaceae bacterium]|nr:hypothetical protein [Defluviitaleaceae bacterium]